MMRDLVRRNCDKHSTFRPMPLGRVVLPNGARRGGHPEVSPYDDGRRRREARLSTTVHPFPFTETEHED